MAIILTCPNCGAKTGTVSEEGKKFDFINDNNEPYCNNCQRHKNEKNVFKKVLKYFGVL